MLSSPSLLHEETFVVSQIEEGFEADDLKEGETISNQGRKRDISHSKRVDRGSWTMGQKKELAGCSPLSVTLSNPDLLSSAALLANAVVSPSCWTLVRTSPPYSNHSQCVSLLVLLALSLPPPLVFTCFSLPEMSNSHSDIPIASLTSSAKPSALPKPPGKAKNDGSIKFSLSILVGPLHEFEPHELDHGVVDSDCGAPGAGSSHGVPRIHVPVETMIS